MKSYEKRLGNRVKNSNYTFSNGLGIYISSEKFNGCSMKRTVLKDSTIKKSSFYQCALTGSRFEKTEINRCKINYVNFQFSTFSNSSFEKLYKKRPLNGDNFDHCFFYKVSFTDVTFSGCSLSCSHFIDCKFENCTFWATTLECTLFENCIFKHVDMKELNIEYSQFVRCTLKNVSFPYTQLPYIIGFSRFYNQEKIHVAADDQTFTFSDYQNDFDNLICYFNDVNEMFPIANIYMFQGKTDSAFELLEQELLQCLVKSDYRMVKHICRLLTFDDTISATNVKRIFDHVKNHINQIETLNQTLECLNNIDEIRRLTMSAKYDKKALKIIIETNIPSTDIDSIQKIIRTVEETISNTLPQCYSKSIEIRHNSPYELFVYLCQSMREIENVLEAIIEALPGIEVGLSVLCSSLALKDRIKRKMEARKKSSVTPGYITKITIIIE